MKHGLLCGLLLGLVADAQAHRLDECLQSTRLSVATNRVDLTLDLSPGVAIANHLLTVIDNNHDGQVSDAESAAYAQRVLMDIRMALDGTNLLPDVVSTTFPPLHEIRAGLGVIRIKATAPWRPLAPGPHALTLTNAHLPAISVYQVNALRPKDAAIEITKQTRDEFQRDYRLEFEVRPAPFLPAHSIPSPARHERGEGKGAPPLN